MADTFARERALLRFAEQSEDAAAGLHQFRVSLPRNATRIAAIISELFAISSVLRQIHNEEGTSRYGPAFYRIDDDLDLLFRTLKHTLDAIFEMFARTLELPEHRAWEDLNYRMEREEDFDLVDRLECYRDFLDDQFKILAGRESENSTELRRELIYLLEAQEDIARRYRRTSISGASTPRPRHLPRPPMHPRLVTPASPTVISDDWDNYTNVSPRQFAFAPEAPLSPTFTSSSSQTMSSSQTSYSNDPNFAAPPSAIVHWANNVYNGSNPTTAYHHSYQSTDRSECYGQEEPIALQHLVRDGFVRILQLPFDSDSLYIRFYVRPSDHRARILAITRDPTTGRPILRCTTLTSLKILRNTTTLQLCRAPRGRGTHQLWAKLNFFLHERMVLFYATFVALKRQDLRPLDALSTAAGRGGPRLLLDRLELEHPDFGEKVLFAGEISHGEMRHALRLFHDRASGVVRLEACALRGARKYVPIWTAFVTRFAYDPDWAELEGGILGARGGGPRGRCVVNLAALRPPPYVVVEGYDVPRNARGEYVLPFTSLADARMFMETWAGLARSLGR